MAWHEAQSLGANQLMALAEKWDAIGLILDDPRLGEVYQQTLFKAGLKWLQFDGTAKKPLWANWVLNALPSANASEYAKVLRNPEASLLLGPSYAVLRHEFEAVHGAVKNEHPLNILVTFGGGDDRGAMAWCFKALLPLLGEHTHLKIISGQANPRNASNMGLIPHSHRAWVDYAIQPAAPWEIMATCHMAVMASGTTAHEANCCQLPMVLVSLVENQHAPGLAWQQAGQAQYVGPWESVSESALQNSVAQCMQAIRTTSPKAQALVDGQGANRVAQAIQNLIHRHPVETL
jgi:spore coat polysaccharide biosynthesis predicted glycosyltransferase SpsG